MGGISGSRQRRWAAALAASLMALLAAAGPSAADDASPELQAFRDLPYLGGSPLLWAQTEIEGVRQVRAGTWRLSVPELDADRPAISAELSLQLPSAGTGHRPGPVILFWALQVEGEWEFGTAPSVRTAAVLDPRSHGSDEPSLLEDVGIPDDPWFLKGSVHRLVGSPTCDATGDCAVRFPLRVGAPGVARSALERTIQRLRIALSPVRTFDAGANIQLIHPEEQGLRDDRMRPTLGAGIPTWGAFRPGPIVPLAAGLEAGMSVENPPGGWDYRVEVAAALQDPTTEIRPVEPDLRVGVWRPAADEPGYRIAYDLRFPAPCGVDRAVALFDRGGEPVDWEPLAGRERITGVFTADTDLPRTVGVARPDRRVVASARYEGTGDTVLVGELDCATGDGMLEFAGVDEELPPDPGPATTATDDGAPPAPDVELFGVPLWIMLLGGLAVLVVVAVGLGIGLPTVRARRAED